WRSAAVAVFFAVHPLHVESVAWVAERKDVLSTLFWLLTLGAYLHYVERPRLARYLLVILTFALGLTAKPMVVTLPFVLFLLDYWPLQRLQGWNRSWPDPARSEEQPRAGSACFRSLPRLLLEKVPLLVLSLVSCAITLGIQTKVIH